MKNPKNIIITGASSGLGKALARHYAQPGVTLYLHGRNPQRLEETAAECRREGADVHAHVGNVTDAHAMAQWIEQADRAAPIDLIIANAGISAGTGGDGGESAAQVRQLFSINIDGVVNTVQPLLPAMIARGRGQIAVVSSLAGMRGLPSSPAYSASKACVRVWAEGMRGWLAPRGVEVNAVCPGFIRTPMTAINPYRMPMMMESEAAARAIAAGLAKNRPRIAFPRPLYWLLWFFSSLSMTITDPIFAKLPAKPSTPSAATTPP